MSARANVALADGEGSPVTHTFVPNGDLAEGVAAYINRNATAPAASETLTISVKRSSASPSDIQVPGLKIAPRSTEIRVRYPATYTDVNTGLVLVDFIDESIMSFKIHPRSVQQRAKNLRVMSYSCLATAITQVSNAVDLGEAIW